MVACSPTSRRPVFQRSVSFAGITAHTRQTRSPMAMPWPEAQSQSHRLVSITKVNMGSRHGRRHHPYRGQRSTRCSETAPEQSCMIQTENGVSKIKPPKDEGIENTSSLPMSNWTESYIASLLQCNLNLDNKLSAIDLPQCPNSKILKGPEGCQQDDKKDENSPCYDEESVNIAFLSDTDMPTPCPESEPIDLSVEKVVQPTPESVPASPRWGTRIQTSETEGLAFFSDDLTIWAPGFDDTNLWTCLYNVSQTNKPQTDGNNIIQDSSHENEKDHQAVTTSLRKQPTVLLMPEPDVDKKDGDVSGDDALPCFPQSLDEYLRTLNNLYGPNGQYQTIPGSPFPTELIGLNSEHNLFSSDYINMDDHENVLFDDEDVLGKPHAKEMKNLNVLRRLNTAGGSLACELSSDYRGLIPSQSDFCCWVCGCLMERQELLHMAALDFDEMPLSPSASFGDMELFCPHCESTRCVFNAEGLLHGGMS